MLRSQVCNSFSPTPFAFGPIDQLQSASLDKRLSEIESAMKGYAMACPYKLGDRKQSVRGSENGGEGQTPLFDGRNVWVVFVVCGCEAKFCKGCALFDERG